MVEEGKVKAIGVSEVPAEDVRKIHGIVSVSAIELECSLFARDCFVRLPHPQYTHRKQAEGDIS